MEINTQVVMSKLALAPVMNLVESCVDDVYTDFNVDIEWQDFTDELCIMCHNWIVEAKIPVDSKGIALAISECVDSMLKKHNAEEKEDIERQVYEGRYFEDAYSDESF